MCTFIKYTFIRCRPIKYTPKKYYAYKVLSVVAPSRFKS
jgi:hypothetical protein